MLAGAFIMPMAQTWIFNANKKKWEAEVQKTTDQYIAQIESLLTHKEKEIMEV